MSMTISIDDDLKREFSEVCSEMGLSASAAFTVFAKAVVREKAIPFEVAAENRRARDAHAYEEQIAEAIIQGYREFEDGQFITRDEYEDERFIGRMAA